MLALTSVPLPASATTHVAGPYGLVLSSVPARIPADGQVYGALVVSLVNSSGLPVVAPYDIQVYLSSAVSGVADVPQSVAIHAGQSYVVANVTTSTTPGSASVTATAAGLKTASVLVRTVVPSGFPDHLVAFAVPPVQLARTTPSEGEIVVQVQDDLGLPARTAGAVTVSVSSSDKRVLNVSGSSFTIPAQSTAAWDNYTTGLVTGSASVTASATGFTSGSTSVTIVQAPGLVLRVTAEPGLIAPGGSTGRIVVSLSDTFGDPAEAPANIQVYLTSSNLTVAVISTGSSGLSPYPLTIPKDQTYAETTFTSKSLGTTNITASAHGLVAGFGKVVVAKSLPPTGLRLFLAPNPVSTGQYLKAIAVGLVHLNKTGAINPSVASTATQAVVTASDNATGRVIWQQYITFNILDSYEAVTFSSTQLPSTTVVTAAAQNLVSAQAVMKTLRPDLPIGPPPSRVVVSPITQSFPADGNLYQGLLISLQDSSGGPAVAPGDVPVHLSLNRTDLFQVVAANSSVTVPANQGFAIAWVRTLAVEGTVNVTAGSSGFRPSWTLLSTRAPSPARLALYASPSPAMLSPGGNQALLAIQLQDTHGNPARARVQTTVSLISSNTTLFARPLSVTIPVHSDYAVVPLKIGGPSTSVITAITPGLRPANATFTSLRLPLGITLSSSAAIIYPNQTATFTASVLAMHEPVQNATVAWHATGGTLSYQKSVTGSNGVASVKVTPTGLGVVLVYATISSALIGSVNSTSAQTVVINYPAKPPAPSLLSQIYSYLPYIGAGVAAVVVVAIFVIRRRRGGNVEEEDTLDIGPAAGEGTALDLRGHSMRKV